MKSTERFKQTIKSYLDKLAENDPLFARAYMKENKNVNDCVTYILNTVKKSGYNGFEDDEIYNMAMHYYDEDNIKVGSSVNCKVVVNHQIEFTEEEKQEAKLKALKRLEEDQYNSLKPKKKSQPTVQQPTLF